MALRQFWFRTFASCGALVASGAAQDARIEQARQVQVLAQDPKVDTPGRATAESPSTPISGEDWESFGVQQLLRDQERLRYFRVAPEFSAFRTSNVALTRVDPRADSFFLAIFPLEYRRPLGGSFQIEAAVRYAAFRYGRFPELNFNSVDAGLGLTYQAAAFGGFTTFVRYNFNQLMNAQSGDPFFQNHTVTLGAQKVFVFSQAHYAYVGLSGQIAFSDPLSAERSEISGFAGYHLQATRKLEADLLWRSTKYLYSEGGREDFNHTVSLALRYRFTECLSLFGSSYATKNSSNNSIFDYEAVNAGGGLSLSLEF